METAARPRKGRHAGKAAGRRPDWREDCSEGEETVGGREVTISLTRDGEECAGGAQAGPADGAREDRGDR